MKDEIHETFLKDLEDEFIDLKPAPEKSRLDGWFSVEDLDKIKGAMIALKKAKG